MTRNTTKGGPGETKEHQEPRARDKGPSQACCAKNAANVFPLIENYSVKCIQKSHSNHSWFLIQTFMQTSCEFVVFPASEMQNIMGHHGYICEKYISAKLCSEVNQKNAEVLQSD